MTKALWELDDGVATITMNAPEVKNAFDQQMLDELAALFDRAATTADARVVVFCGAEGSFCAGGDVRTMGNSTDPVERKRNLQHGPHLVQRAIARVDKPIIAMIDGVAFGAGLDMALACDMRIASTTAVMCESYINLGLIAGDGGAYLLPRVVGLPRAMEMLLSGRRVTGEEAAAIGLVNRAVPAEQLAEATYELARTLAAKPPEGLRTMKRLVLQSLSMDFMTSLEMASSHMGVLQCGAEHQEALGAFRAADAARRAAARERTS